MAVEHPYEIVARRLAGDYGARRTVYADTPQEAADAARAALAAGYEAVQVKRYNRPPGYDRPVEVAGRLMGARLPHTEAMLLRIAAGSLEEREKWRVFTNRPGIGVKGMFGRD